MTKTAIQWMIEPLRHYAQFSGRAPRAEYWWFAALAIMAQLAAFCVDSLLGWRHIGLRALLTFVYLLPHLAVSVRRLHDIDRTGWWVVAPSGLGTLLGVASVMARRSTQPAGSTAGLLVLVITSLAVGIVFLILYCRRGTLGPNRFGPDPLGAVD